jgi:uncharacterized protein (TIGR02646 family)
MKHVMKGASAPEFETWKALANPDWSPTYGNLQNPQKRALHVSLLNEQGWVCCYCGRAISHKDSHIEHFRPQENYPELELSYQNLHASCIRDTPATKPPTPLHCGHVKGAGFDEALHISPLNPECEVRFLYTSKGHIIPSDVADSQATYMVELLRLDIKFLCNRREEEVNRVFDPAFLATVTADELGLLRDAFRRRDEAGRAQSFGHVLARFSEQRLLDTTP